MDYICYYQVELVEYIKPTRIVLCRLELTLLNMSFPTMVAMVGKTRAPHRILVAETWSAKGLASAGIRGTGHPIPKEEQEDIIYTNAAHVSSCNSCNRHSGTTCLF